MHLLLKHLPNTVSFVMPMTEVITWQNNDANVVIDSACAGNAK